MTTSIIGTPTDQNITNEEVLRRTGLTTLYFTLNQRRLRLLGHILRMGDERIPESMLYSELVNGRRKCGRPTLGCKDVCKRDLITLNIGTVKCEYLAYDRANGDLLYTKVLKKEKNNFLRYLSRRRIKSTMSFI